MPHPLIRRMHAAAIGLAMAATGLLTAGATPAAASTSMTTIVSAARGELGSNGCPSKYHGLSCSQSWCAAFALWAWQKGGVDVSTLGDSVTTFRDYGDRNGTWHDPGTYNPQPGDAMIFGGRNFEDKASGGAHIGIVEKVDANGTITEIGGNQNSAVTEVTGTESSIEKDLEGLKSDGKTPYKFLGYVSPLDTREATPASGMIVSGSTIRSFDQAPDGSLRYSYYDGARWTQATIAGAGSIKGAPVAQMVSTTDIRVFATGADGALKYWAYFGGAWHSASLGGSITGSPTAQTLSNGDIRVFATSAVDGSLQYWGFFSGGWHGPVSLGGSITGSPTAQTTTGQTRVFARGADGTLQYWAYFPDSSNRWGWHGPYSLGGSIADTLTAHTTSNGEIRVFGLSTVDGSLQYWGFFGGAWHGPNSLGGSITGGPTAQTLANGDIRVFATNAYDGALKYFSYFGGGWHTADLGGSIAGSPMAYTSSNGVIQVIGRDLKTGKVIHYRYNGSAWSMETVG